MEERFSLHARCHRSAFPGGCAEELHLYLLDMYVYIYSFVDHLGTLARCTMQLRPRSFGVSSGGFGFLEDGTVERRKPAAMPLFAVAAWLYCRRRRS